MPAKNRVKAKSKHSAMPRMSVSFSPESFQMLENLAAKKKVSVGWVVRDAVEKYVSDQWPLFANIKEG